MKQALRWVIGAGLVFPLAFLGMLTLARNWQFPALFPGAYTLEHWAGLAGQQQDLLRSLARSLLMSATVALLATGAGLLAARPVAYSRHARRWLWLAYLPYAMAPVILATCWQFFFIRMGLSGRWEGVLLAQGLIAFPYSVLFFFGFWNPELRAMEQLTATLGGSAWQCWKGVILPMARRPVAMGYFQLFLLSWFEYGLTTLIGVGKVKTLTVSVFAYINEANIFLAALSGCLLALPPVILLLLNRSFWGLRKL